MSNEILSDLTLRIRANTAELNDGLKKAGSEVNRFSKGAKDTGAAVSKSFADMRGAVSSMTSGITSQLQGLTGQLGVFGSAIPSIITGFKGMTVASNLFKVALASTGIGLIVVALASLITYLTKTQAGMDLVNKAMAGFKAVIATVMDRVGYLGEAITAVFSGDFSHAAEMAKKAVSGIGEQMADNYVTARKMADAESKLRDEKIAWITKEAQLEEKKSELLMKAKQKELYSEAQRLKFIQEAQAVQKQLTNENIALKQKELKILEAQQNMGENTAADNKAAQELRKEIINLRSQENGKMRELIEQENSARGILIKANEERAKALAYTQRISEALANTNIASQSAVMPTLDTKAIDTGLVANLKIKVQQIDPRELSETQQQVIESWRVAQAEMQAIGAQVSGMIQDTMTNASVSIAEALGQAIAGNTDGLKNLFNGLLGMVIDFGKQFGKMLIKIGMATVAFEKLAIGGGPAAIAAGIALVALTSAAGAFLSKGAMDRKANGGISPGGVTLVGERGPELVNLPQGANVIRSNKTEQMLGKGQTIHVHVTGRVSGQDILMAVEETQRRNGINF